MKYDDNIESALTQIAVRLHGDYRLSKRMIGLLLLQDDAEIHNVVREQEGMEYKSILDIIQQTKSQYSHSPNYIITMARQAECNSILSDVVSNLFKRKRGIAESLSRLMMNPWTGIPILLVVLYFGIYQFVGVFAAGTVVDWIEGVLFGDAESGYILPYVTRFFETIIPFRFLQELFVHDYGIITLGIRYAIALILPIVGAFFIVFSIIEDTGYLPRLAMLVDRMLKWIGLNGRAVIPMILGLGCDTMATLVTRTLETKRERIIATFLLALGVPCSAQQAVFIGILSQNSTALLLWISVVVGELLLVGYLSAKALPGDQPSFYMEMPPLRLPKITNVLTKTYSRMQWYLLEVLPLFVIASVFIWIGRLTRIFDLVIAGLQPIVRTIGLPNNVAEPILYGFFRRDYAAAALYDEATGATGLTGNEFLVAAVVLTLFLPCIAQFLIMVKERGVKATLMMAVAILILAFGTGFLLTKALNIFGINLSLGG